MIVSIPDLIKLIQSLKKNTPDFISKYLPAIPDNCNDEYQHIADVLAPAELSALPGAICSLPAQDFECIRKIGDGIDDVSMITDLIGKGLVQTLVDALEKPFAAYLTSLE